MIPNIKFNFLVLCSFSLYFFFVGCAPLQPTPHQPSQQPTPAPTYSSFPVLEYHLIGSEEKRWTRTADNFRKDLEWLHANGYYPMNLRDILTGFEGLPAGKTPVVLTFDDTSSSQFRYLPNGEVDPNCAAGIIKAFHDKHPKDWPLRATFFILIQTNNPDRNIFGQPEHPEYKQKKLKQLIDWGMEVGSHTYSHDRLSDISFQSAAYSLARSSQELTNLCGIAPVSLAMPMGLYPTNEALFSGQYQKIKYDFKLVCEVAGGKQPALNSAKFNPYHINRIQTINSEWKKFFNRK